MSAVVVHHQMQRRVAGKLPIDAPQKLEKFLMPVTFVTIANDLALKHIEGSEKGSRSISLVIVRHRTAAPLLQRQPWLSAIQGLNLALFVNAEHDRFIRMLSVISKRRNLNISRMAAGSRTSATAAEL
jgi:hypothetical protein